MTQNRKDAIATLERLRDGKIVNEETGERKTATIVARQEELDAAEAMLSRAKTRVAAASVGLRKTQALIDAAEKIVVATDALAEFDADPESDDESETDDAESADLEFDDEDGDSDDETPRGAGGRFVSRSA